jgi:hypothetical protein
VSLIVEKGSGVPGGHKDIELSLRAQGFKIPIQVHGSHTNKLDQIEAAFPPPMAKVIGHSIRSHVHAVMQMVNSARGESVVENGMKRPAEEGLENISNKRRHRAGSDTPV